MKKIFVIVVVINKYLELCNTSYVVGKNYPINIIADI